MNQILKSWGSPVDNNIDHSDIFPVVFEHKRASELVFLALPLNSLADSLACKISWKNITTDTRAGRECFTEKARGR